ncbi:MAG: DUF2851 family protein [Flavobacteriales bacterium]|jgi:hypothetical protein
MTNVPATINERMTKISEDFIQYVWKFQRFVSTDFMAASGQKVEVIHPGTHNRHGGPDFLHAQIRIDGTLWNGHVEIHLKSSDWLRHGHQDDDHYKYVILHVVLQHDREIYLNQPNDLPVLAINNYIQPDFVATYHRWLQQFEWIPCEKKSARVDPVIWENVKASMLVERLQERVSNIITELELNKGNWAQITLREFFKAFGFKSNAGAMALLADSIPYTIISRHQSDPMQIEALLFGQAGMLEKNYESSYADSLRKEYRILQLKYGLKPIEASCWNLGRIRPQNSPCIRLAQIATALCASEHLTTAMLHGSAKEITTWLRQPVNPYWDTHYAFDKPFAKPTNGMLGKSSAETIIINAACRLQFAFGKFHQDPRMIEKAISNLESIGAEDNVIIRKWTAEGVHAQNAGDSQSLIQLYTVYCTNEKCLNCAVGHQLLNSTNT